MQSLLHTASIESQQQSWPQIYRYRYRYRWDNVVTE